MKILVFPYERTIFNENNKIINNKDIICPECGEICLIKIYDYNITLYECKNGHELNNISLDEYKNTQNLEQSKIICNNCKNMNKSNSYNNQFFKCISCQQNLCPLCKSTHNKEHDIIDYDKNNYLCNIHNEKFISYCEKCKKNLCMFCESEHKKHSSLIYYGNIIPEKDIFKNQINELRIKID